MNEVNSTDELASFILKAVEDKKAHQVVLLDLQGISLIADYFIICHGQSEVQVQAVASEARKVAQQLGVNIRGFAGYDGGRWVLLDLGDVVLHVFHREEREYYNIERLWSDAKVIERV